MCSRPTAGDLGRTPARFTWKREESGQSSPGTRNRAALTSLPAAEERGRSSPGTGLRRRAGDFVAGAARGRFSAVRARGFGRNDGNSGARGVEARQEGRGSPDVPSSAVQWLTGGPCQAWDPHVSERKSGAWQGGRGGHVAMRQLTRWRRRRLTRCNSCVDDEWVHERGRIEHKPYSKKIENT
jgi:hypothetical protein